MLQKHGPDAFGPDSEFDLRGHRSNSMIKRLMLQLVHYLACGRRPSALNVIADVITSDWWPMPSAQ